MARKEFETLTPQMFYILVVLNVPRHGYEIMNEIMRITNDEIRVGAGTLYTLLSRFQNDGYIELVSEIDRKKIYQITKIGKYKINHQLFTPTCPVIQIIALIFDIFQKLMALI